MDVMTGLAALGQAINIAKFIREADQGLQGAELKAKMAEIYEKLGDAKMALVDAREIIEEQQREIQQLREAAKFKAENTVSRGGLTYEREANGSIATYPFCPKCEGVEGIHIRLLAKSNAYEAMCPNCKTDYAGQSVWFRKPDQLEREEAHIRALNERNADRDWVQEGCSHRIHCTVALRGCPPAAVPLSRCLTGMTA